MLKDLGNAKYLLELELSCSTFGIYLSQWKYCLQILEDCDFLVAKPVSHPMVLHLRLSATDGIPLNDEEASHYRRLVERLLYLQISRPDICFTVHKLSQYISRPYSKHLRVAKHLLRYLKGTARQGILLSSTNSFQLKA